MTQRKYRAIVPIIEAIQYKREHNIHEVQYFFEKVGDSRKFRYQEPLGEYAVVAANGDGSPLVVLDIGDYIMRDITGLYWVYGEDEFLKKYEGVPEDGESI